MDAFDIIKDEEGNVDPYIGDELYNPYESLTEEFKSNPEILPEIRKVMNVPIPEL